MFARTLPFQLVTCLFVAGSAAAFPTQDDQTPGAMATNFRQKNKVWTRLDMGFVDGKVTSKPGTTKLDRRIESMAVAGFDAGFNQRWGVRGNFKADYSKRRQSEEEEPRADVDETVTTYAPSLDVTFVTDKGLEIFGGAVMQMQPAYKQTVDAGNVSSETAFDATKLTVRRFGVVRRSGVWSGGFYYVMGAETDRGFEQSASDGSSLAASDVVFVPSRVGVFGEFSAWATLWDFELDFVQARGMGPKDDAGSTIYTDYFEARMGGLYMFGGAWGTKTSVAHKTLSYANNSYVTLESIPITSIKLLGVLGSDKSYGYAGVIMANGKDGQSLPEFNATYELNALAVTVGLQLSL